MDPIIEGVRLITEPDERKPDSPPTELGLAETQLEDLEGL